MATEFDINKFRQPTARDSEYERQLARLRRAGKDVACIERAVAFAMKSLQKHGRSFVIYGEPQSGKTEMMICLTGKLLDEGYRFILHLLNDSVDLLGQNLGRFKESGLAPGARNFSEILDPAVSVGREQSYVIFCKKNGKDLRKLLNKIGSHNGIIIIDDEADYASPNSKINSGGSTVINDLIGQLLGGTGTYIGVTATPARLDLNNTFDNDSSLWVHFPPHTKYTGQDTFFPLVVGAVDYIRTPLSDSGAEPKHARRALFGFLINVAYLNLFINGEKPQNYSFLVHTSGKKVDHKSDWETIHKALDVLTKRNTEDADFNQYVQLIWDLSNKRYPDKDSDQITHYVLDKISRNAIIILNSERDWKDNSSAATKPSSLFTIIIGGNIVSRGVTLDNLLSMFFTRDVRHKIQQDTYIQRARMFGARGDYLKFFELTIPSALYLDWHRCFVYHRLALSAITDGLGSLVWLGDKRISAVASASIDRASVDLDRGEMSFAIFPYNLEIEKIANANNLSNKSQVEKLSGMIGDPAFPPYLRRYMESTMLKGDASLALHRSSDISGQRISDEDKKEVRRTKGFFGKSQVEQTQYPNALHHLKVFHNAQGNARLFYKFVGSVQFLKNTRR